MQHVEKKIIAIPNIFGTCTIWLSRENEGRRGAGAGGGGGTGGCSCFFHTPSTAFRHRPAKLKEGCGKPVLGVWFLFQVQLFSTANGFEFPKTTSPQRRAHY